MIARTLTVDVGRARVDAVVDAYRTIVRPIHQRADGLTAHYVMVNRELGRVGFVGLWEAPDAVQSVADELEPARQRLWDTFGETPSVDVFEIVDELRSVS